jgi:hypothetical protein
MDSGHGVFDQEGLVTHVFGTVLGLNKDRCLGRLTTIASAYNTNVVTPLNERLRQCDQARRFAVPPAVIPPTTITGTRESTGRAFCAVTRRLSHTRDQTTGKSGKKISVQRKDPYHDALTHRST